MPVSSASPSNANAEEPRLSLLGGFCLQVDGTRIDLPLHARRVLAYLSLHRMSETGFDRNLLAARLWSDAPPDKSRASLRTALWRIRGAAADVVHGEAGNVALADSVQVDVHQFRRCAEQLLTQHDPQQKTPELRLLTSGVDLLPEWDEDWLLLAREQLRQLRLHALEVVARRLGDQGRYPEAIDIILPVISEEPLRESAHAVLIDAHLAQGNLVEARRQLDILAAGLRRELNLQPSEALLRKVGLPVRRLPAAVRPARR
jgi:DNA-binding SARP family transcriptional activator